MQEQLYLGTFARNGLHPVMWHSTRPGSAGLGSPEWHGSFGGRLYSPVQRQQNGKSTQPRGGELEHERRLSHLWRWQLEGGGLVLEADSQELGPSRGKGTGIRTCTGPRGSPREGTPGGDYGEGATALRGRGMTGRGAWGLQEGWGWGEGRGE